jgi:hypothetical protein
MKRRRCRGRRWRRPRRRRWRGLRVSPGLVQRHRFGGFGLQRARRRRTWRRRGWRRPRRKRGRRPRPPQAWRSSRWRRRSRRQGGIAHDGVGKDHRAARPAARREREARCVPRIEKLKVEQLAVGETLSPDQPGPVELLWRLRERAAEEKLHRATSGPGLHVHCCPKLGWLGATRDFQDVELQTVRGALGSGWRR